jgi:hypothetical protein
MAHTETDEDYQFLTDIPEAKFQVKKSKKRGKTIYNGASNDKVARAVSLVSHQHYLEYFEVNIGMDKVLQSLSRLGLKLTNCSLCIHRFILLGDTANCRGIYQTPSG